MHGTLFPCQAGSHFGEPGEHRSAGETSGACGVGAQHPGGDGPEGGAGWGSAPWGRDQEVCSWLARADGQCESTPLRLLPAGGPAPLSAALVPPVSPSPAPHLQTGAPEVEGLPPVHCWHCLVAKSCLTLVTPWTVARQAPLSVYWAAAEPELAAEAPRGGLFSLWDGAGPASPGDLQDLLTGSTTSYQPAGSKGGLGLQVLD